MYSNANSNSTIAQFLKYRNFIVYPSGPKTFLNKRIGLQLFCYNFSSRGAQIKKKNRRNCDILVTRRVKWGKFLCQDPGILRAIAQNLG